MIFEQVKLKRIIRWLKIDRWSWQLEIQPSKEKLSRRLFPLSRKTIWKSRGKRFSCTFCSLLSEKAIKHMWQEKSTWKRTEKFARLWNIQCSGIYRSLRSIDYNFNAKTITFYYFFLTILFTLFPIEKSQVCFRISKFISELWSIVISTRDGVSQFYNTKSTYFIPCCILYKRFHVPISFHLLLHFPMIFIPFVLFTRFRYFLHGTQSRIINNDGWEWIRFKWKFLPRA